MNMTPWQKIRIQGMFTNMLMNSNFRERMFSKDEKVRKSAIGEYAGSPHMEAILNIPKEIQSMDDGIERTTEYFKWAYEQLGM